MMLIFENEWMIYTDNNIDSEGQIGLISCFVSLSNYRRGGF